MRLAGVELPTSIAQAVRECGVHFAAAIGFSFFINLLFLAPAIYMLQIFDRVVATGGVTTLFYITLALLIALLTLTMLDAIRGRLFIRAGAALDRRLAPLIVTRMITTGGTQSAQALRDFDTVRQTLSTPVAAAVIDAPWAPVFIFVCFLLHFWIGMLALVSTGLLFAVAWRNQKVTRQTVEFATRALADSHAETQQNGSTVLQLSNGGYVTLEGVSLAEWNDPDYQNWQSEPVGVF